MSTSTLLIIAAIVFSLMLTGLVLTLREFLRISDEPSKIKGTPVREAGPN